MIRLKTNPSTLHQQGDKIGTYHFMDNPNLYEPQRSNNFEFVVTDINGILRAGMDANSQTGRINNAQEVLRLSVASATVPHFSQDVLRVRRGNSEIKFAGIPSFPEGSLVINDWIGVGAKDALMAWQNLSYDVRTEKVGLASDYKKDCVLIDYSPDQQIVRKWNLKGCWISGIGENDRSSDGNEIVKVTATIQYDRAELDTSEDL